MPHDAKLDGEAQFIMWAATHLTFQPVNWIESVVPEQTILVSREAKKNLCLRRIDQPSSAHSFAPRYEGAEPMVPARSIAIELAILSKGQTDVRTSFDLSVSGKANLVPAPGSHDAKAARAVRLQPRRHHSRNSSRQSPPELRPQKRYHSPTSEFATQPHSPVAK